MENIGVKKMVSELKKLNPGVSVRYDCDTWPAMIITSSARDTLKYPDGYYWNAKNGLTNKHNTASGMYECFELMSESEYAG